MQKCVVTGGAGFIGSHIVDALLALGCEVAVLDNLSTGKLENMAGFRDRIEFVEGSVTDHSTTRRLFAGADTVFHQAALASVPRSVADPIASNHNNIDGTLNVLWSAHEAGVKRVVYAASSSAYGDTAVMPKVESMPASPLSPYAITKYVGELYCDVFSRIYGLSTVGLRYFNVFGPRQDPESQYAAVIPIFITKLLKGEAPTIYGDGGQSRDFTFVANVVEANLRAALADDPGGRTVNIACGGRITLNELYDIIRNELDSTVEPIHADPRPGDVRHSQADISAAAELLGYAPQIDFRDGLATTVAWYKRFVNV